MAEEKENQEYFDVYYHANEYSKLFFYCFNSLEDAIEIMKKEYPTMIEADAKNVRHPFITVVHKKQTEEEIKNFYFFNISN